MKIILFLILITNLMAQPGPTQTQEAGISNYQIQALPPANTPVAGKQFLYNANNILSTKDSAGTIQRVNKETENILANPDFEQVLDSYTFTAGRAVINIATPLFDKRSVDLDTTAINDNISTIPYLIPKGLQGQNCMAKLVYSGGDTGLTMRVMNADGVVVGQKVLAVAANPTPAFIVFGCPAGTATVNQRTLRIDVIQNSATNAALATLDGFYLGRFESNTMTVSEAPQWYYYTVTANINGLFTFPAPTTSTNDKTLFDYGANILTAKKPMSLTLNAFSNWIGGTPPGDKTTVVTCIIDGVSRTINTHVIGTQTGGMSLGSHHYISATVNLNPGDTCNLSMTYSHVAVTSYTVNITATPLPQLATIVNTNTPRAGFLGKRTWATTCTNWSRTSTVYGPFGVQPTCAPGVINSGLVIPDVVTDAQLPKVTLSKLPKGKITVKIYGMFGKASISSIASFGLALNGVIIPFNFTSYGTTSPTDSLYWPNLFFTFDNPNDLNQATIELWTKSNTGVVNFYSENTSYTPSIVVSYEPDLSDPYSIPELYAALPPQVINSSGKIYRYETCYVTNAGVASLGSPNCNNWIQSVTRTAAGFVSINFLPNIWSTAPQCFCSPLTDHRVCSINNGAANTPITITGGRTEIGPSTSGGVYEDWNFYFTCGGLQ